MSTPSPADINVVMDVRFVMKEGRVYKQL